LGNEWRNKVIPIDDIYRIDVEECPEIPDELGENKSNLGSQNDSLNGQISK